MFVFGLTCVTGTPGTETTHLVEQSAREMLPGRFEIFGYVLEDGNWIKTRTAKSRRQIAVALEFFVRNVLMLYDVLTVRIGRSLPRLPATPTGSHSLLVWWNGSLQHCNTFEPDTTEAFSTRWLAGDDWRSYKYIHVIMDQDNDHKFQDILVDDGEDVQTQADASGRTDLSDPERLSPIPETDEAESEEQEANEEMLSFSTWSGPVLQQEQMRDSERRMQPTRPDHRFTQEDVWLTSQVQLDEYFGRVREAGLHRRCHRSYGYP